MSFFVVLGLSNQHSTTQTLNMPKLMKTKFTRPTTGPFELKSRKCKICCEVIPVGPCEKPGCKETVRKAMEAIADGFLKDDEPEETKELEVKEPAERFSSRVLPDATGLQALMIVSQHMNTTLDELMVNKQHQNECFEAMTDEDRFYASAIILRMNYERSSGQSRSFTFYEPDLPQMGSAPGWGDFELSQTRSTALINYLASQGFKVYVPLRPADSTFLHLCWDGLPPATQGEYKSANFACHMPTGPLNPIGTVLRRPLPNYEEEEEEPGLHAHARDRVHPLNSIMGARERAHTLTVIDRITDFDSRVLFGPQGVQGAYNHFIITLRYSGEIELLGAPGDVVRFTLDVEPQVNWRHVAWHFAVNGQWMLFNMPHLCEGTFYEAIFHFFTPQVPQV